MTRILRYAVIFIFCLLAAGCNLLPSSPRANQDGPPKGRVNKRHIHRTPNAVPRALPKSRYGNPKSYVVMGKRYYVLNSAKGYNVRGIASWYGRKFQGRLTSSREPYNMFAMTAASPVLPIPTFVRVTNLANGRSVVVKVNDRGPFAPNRILDLSYAAAVKLGYAEQGTAMVQVTAINPKRPNALPLAPAPTQLVSRPSGSSHQLFLQLGAFRFEGDAKRFRSKMAITTGRNVLIKRKHVRDQMLYLVQVGPLRGSGESDRLQSRLAREGINSFTVVS